MSDITEQHMKMLKLQLKIRELKQRGKRPLKSSNSNIIMKLEKKQEAIPKCYRNLIEELDRMKRKNQAEKEKQWKKEMLQIEREIKSGMVKQEKERMRQEKEKMRLRKIKEKEEQDERIMLIRKIRQVQLDLEFEIGKVHAELVQNDIDLACELYKTRTELVEQFYKLKTNVTVPMNESIKNAWSYESKAKVQTVETKRQQNAGKLVKLQEIQRSGQSLPKDLEKCTNAKLKDTWVKKLRLLTKVLKRKI